MSGLRSSSSDGRPVGTCGNARLSGVCARLKLDAGRRHAVTEQARDNYEATVANYRQNVLTAFQEVEDNLAALRFLDQESVTQAAAVAAAIAPGPTTPSSASSIASSTRNPPKAMQ